MLCDGRYEAYRVLKPSPHEDSSRGAADPPPPAGDPGRGGLMLGTEMLRHHRLLVARIVGQDHLALKELYGLLFSRLYQLAHRFVGNERAATEIVQDTFIKLWRNASSYAPDRGEVITWAGLMCRSIALDHLRKVGRERNREVFAELEAIPALDPPIAQESLLNEFVNHLTSAQRQALELAYFDGLSREEIATRMRITVANVKNHLRRGIIRLRSVISADE